jgi:hypothetical protein
LVARRTLHFAKEQVFWECGTGCCCETFPDGAEHTEKKPFFIKRVYDSFVLNGDASSDELWDSLISDYTSRRLTKANDKLVALSGLVEELHMALEKQRIGSVRYLAGLWEFQLPHALLWTTSATSSRPVECRVPAWSWASVEGMVTTCLNEEAAARSAIDILSINIDHVGHQWGQVNGGELHVRGRLCKLDGRPLPPE